jgi:hypothetical protein
VTILAYFIGSLALAAGTGLLIVALVRLEAGEPEGRVSPGWRMRHAPGAERQSEVAVRPKTSQRGGWA